VTDPLRSSGPSRKASFPAPKPFNLPRTVLPLKGTLYRGQLRSVGGDIFKAARTPDGVATIRLRHVGSKVEVEAWGRGAQWLIDTVPALLGFDDDVSGFVPAHPAMRDQWLRSKGARWGKTNRVIEALVPAIIGQKVTGKGAAQSLRALARRYGESAPGPIEMHLLPEPETLAALPYYDYHPLGIEKKRAGAVRRVAARAVRLELLSTEPLEEGYRVLQAFEGVGPWTAALVAGIALGDADAVPVGDYHIPNTVAWALAGEERGTDARMLELLEPYRGHRGRVIRLLEASGIGAPAYGPRNPVRSIATS